jgi:hypothetical protein
MVVGRRSQRLRSQSEGGVSRQVVPWRAKKPEKRGWKTEETGSAWCECCWAQCVCVSLVWFGPCKRPITL